MIASATKFALSPSPVSRDPKPSIPSMCDYGSAWYWDGRYLSSPLGSAFDQYCNYDALKPIIAAHCYLPTINKTDTASGEDNGSNYDNNKGGDGRRSSTGRGRSSGVGGMRRTALIIGSGDLDLSSGIASDRLEGVGFKSVLSLDFLRVVIGQMDECRSRIRAGGRDDGENGSSSDTAIATMTWDHSD